MAYFYGGTCYQSVQDAHLAACAGFSASGLENGELVTYSCTGAVSGSSMELRRVTDSTSTLVYRDWPDMPDCSTAFTPDFALDWLSITLPVIAVVWGLRKLYEVFNSSEV